ncbi:MAG: VOC family protein [Bacteroidia bacterium]
MKFRFARHTNNLEKLKSFYTDVLGFDLLGGFEDHDNYNGIFLGYKNAGWHLEFTESDQPANHTFDEDDILVFYPESEEKYTRLLAHLREHQVEFIQPQNPYWSENGVMILDPDGYRVVIAATR